MKLAIVGLGLIGGSFAKGVRSRKLCGEIVGLDLNPQRAAQALSLGLIDRVVDEVPADAEVVLVATPAPVVASWIAQLAGHGGLLFDVASVKAPVIEAVRLKLSQLPPRFVPCHPIAGSELGGPTAADGDLFAGRSVIFTPESETDPGALQEVGALWGALGARTLSMEAPAHDEVLAVTSHLPHLLVCAYLQQVKLDHLGCAGSGFEDFTRIGAADPELWAGIFRLNRAPLLAALEALKNSMASFQEALANDEPQKLAAMVAAAAAKRRRLGRS